MGQSKVYYGLVLYLVRLQQLFFIDLPIRGFGQIATKSLASINFDNLIILKYFVLWSWSESG